MEHRNIIRFLTLFILSRVYCSAASPSIPAIFAFGDSTVDSGNNNHIATIAHANHIPYGRALPGHVASGRFSDGKLASDYLASALGIKELLPAYLDSTLTDEDLTTGVSFGSAGTGLDQRTVKLSEVFNLTTQLGYFDEAMMRVENHVGQQKASEIVGNSLFLISVGANDLLYNLYLLPSRAFEYSVSWYHDFLVQKLKSVVEMLYGKGGRKFMVVGVPPVGCLPVEVTVGSLIPSDHMLQRLCNTQHNNDSQAYNTKLQGLISRLQGNLTEAKFAYLDVYETVMDMHTNPATYGFEVTGEGCCGTGLLETGPMCNILSPTCLDASKFLFWDSVHLTQAAYSVIAKNAAKIVPV